MPDFNKFATISQWCLEGIRLRFLFILASTEVTANEYSASFWSDEKCPELRVLMTAQLCECIKKH